MYDNSTSTDFSVDAPTVAKVAIYAIIILSSIVGNIWVFVAVAKFHALRTVSNTFVLSLASADLAVSILVLPLSIQEAYFKQWFLGEVVCRFWISGDVLFVTISIFNLAAISIDRYRSIKNPLKYSLKRTNRLAYRHIATVWLLSLVVGVPPFYFAVFDDGACYLSLNPYYIVPGTTIGFFLPLTVVLFTNVRIFGVARKHATRVGHVPMTASEHTGCESTRRQQSTVTKKKVKLSMQHAPTSTAGRSGSTDERDSNTVGPISSAQPDFGPPIAKKISIARERRAARTVAIIIGVFTACWMPFFVAVTAASLCSTCDPNSFNLQILTWMGYANSVANPIIYTIFNKDFRQAFGKILRCRFR